MADHNMTPRRHLRVEKVKSIFGRLSDPLHLDEENTRLMCGYIG
jgi:hypothetical protein